MTLKPVPIVGMRPQAPAPQRRGMVGVLQTATKLSCWSPPLVASPPNLTATVWPCIGLFGGPPSSSPFLSNWLPSTSRVMTFPHFAIPHIASLLRRPLLGLISKIAAISAEAQTGWYGAGVLLFEFRSGAPHESNLEARASPTVVASPLVPVGFGMRGPTALSLVKLTVQTPKLIYHRR